MNIQNVNNVNNIVQNNPIRANEEQAPQEEQNVQQNPAAGEVNRDNFTRSQEAERLQELNEPREELHEELEALEQEENPNEAQPGRAAEERREPDDIERERRNMTQQSDATDRRQREAINTYTEQNQNAVRAQNNNRNIMNLFG